MSTSMYCSWITKLQLFSLLCLLGCGSPPETPPEQLYADSMCGSCVAASCIPALEACADDGRCEEYLLCIGRCPIRGGADVDETCEARCRSAVPDSSSRLIAAVTSCRQEGAGSACTTCRRERPRRGIYDNRCAPSASTDSCKKCKAESCCELVDRCANNKECDGIFDCYEAKCDSLTTSAAQIACRFQCFAAHPSGRTDFLLRQGCITAKCDVECLSPTPPKHDGCQVCESEQCGEAVLETKTNEACLNSFACQYSCASSDTACREQCKSDWQTCFTGPQARLVECSDSRCLTACPYQQGH